MKLFLYSLALSVVIAAGAVAYSDRVQSDLRDNIVRLHIVANSDSEEDQAVKLRVRDKIIENASEITALSGSGCAERAADTAKGVLIGEGFDYGAKGEYCLDDFPEKSYKNITLPAGKYRAVKITLGEGKGHNWWCVLYPPVCLVDKDTAVIDKASQKLLKDALDDETYEIITNRNDGKIRIKFKSVELIQKLKEKITKK